MRERIVFAFFFGLVAFPVLTSMLPILASIAFLALLLSPFAIILFWQNIRESLEGVCSWVAYSAAQWTKPSKRVRKGHKPCARSNS